MVLQAGHVQLPGLSANSHRTTRGHSGLPDRGVVSPHKGEKVAFGFRIKRKKAVCEKFSHGGLGRRVCQAVWLLQVLTVNFYARTKKSLLFRGTFSHSNLLFL